MIAYAPLDLFEFGTNTSFDFKLPIMILNLQKAIELVRNNNIYGNGFDMGTKFDNIYNSKSKVIAEKVFAD